MNLTISSRLSLPQSTTAMAVQPPLLFGAKRLTAAEKILADMPEEDRVALQSLFEELLKGNGNHPSFGFTLLGDKPVTFGIVQNGELPTDNYYYHMPDLANNQDGLRALKKYKPMLEKNGRFAIRILKEDSQTPFVMLINKPAFIKRFNDHRDDLPLELTAEAALEKVLTQPIENPYSDPCDLFSNDVATGCHVWGLLLGFPSRDAGAFIHEIAVRREVEKPGTYPNLQPSEGFATLQEEHDYLTENYGLPQHLPPDEAGMPKWNMFLNDPVSIARLDYYRSLNGPVQKMANDKENLLANVLKAFTTKTRLDKNA